MTVYFGLRNFAPDLLAGLSQRAAAPTASLPQAASTGPAAGGAAGPVLLRVRGSNTIGAELAPALARAFFESLGAQGIRVVPGGADELAVEGTLPGEAAGAAAPSPRGV